MEIHDDAKHHTMIGNMALVSMHIVAEVSTAEVVHIKPWWRRESLARKNHKIQSSQLHEGGDMAAGFAR